MPTLGYDDTPTFNCCMAHVPAQEQPFQHHYQLRYPDFYCSYCGSLHPDKFMALVEQGAEVGTTTKAYKAYIKNGDRTHEKFYFGHLSEEQQQRFVDLLNAQKVKFEGGLGFSVLPFFVTPVKGEPDAL